MWDSASRGYIEQIDPGDRYGAEWARQAQARVFDIDRRCRERAESIALLTATASTTWPGEDTPIPPVVHFRELRKSLGARQKALERALKGCRYRAVRAYGVGDEGYLHRHTAVYVDRVVSRSDLKPWVSAHTDNAPLARTNAHGGGAIRVDNDVEVDSSSDISCIGAYLMENIPGCGTTGERDHGIQSAPTNVQRGATVLDRVGAEPVTVGPVSPASE